VFAAILRGLGRQKMGAYIIVPSFNLIGLPLAVYLAYGPLHMEVTGLWWGTCVGTVVSALAQLFAIIYWTDWEHEVVRCLRRLVESGPTTDSLPSSRGSQSIDVVTDDTQYSGYGALTV
ncbi:ethionine resistance protein, partial [Coemansia asiatica]